MDALRESDARALAVEDSILPGPNVFRLLDIEGANLYTVTYGGFADFAKKVIGKPKSKARQLAADAGLVDLGTIDSPGAVVLIAYGTKLAGVWTIAVGKLDERGELPESTFAVAHGTDGMFACRLPLAEPAVGKALHIWVVPSARDAAVTVSA